MEVTASMAIKGVDKLVFTAVKDAKVVTSIVVKSVEKRSQRPRVMASSYSRRLRV